MSEYTTSKKVMIIEDNLLNQKITASIIKALGHEAIQVFEGTKALEAIKQEKPDLIILDIIFPDISGIEICQKVKLDKELKDIPVIVVTSLSTDEDKKQILKESGCDSYIAKPFTAELFVQTVASYIAVKHIDWS